MRVSKVMQKTSFSGRVFSIDYMKGVLISLMIFVHIIIMPHTLDIPFWGNLISLTAFPGFVFCFGYVCNLAYGKAEIGVKKFFGIVGRLLLAHYLSSIAWLLIVERTFSFESLFGIITLASIFHFNEYMISFVLLASIYLLFRRQLTQIVQSKLILLFFCINLVIVILPRSLFTIQSIPQMGLFFPVSSAVHFFPIFAYFSWFLLGIYFSLNKVRLRPVHLLLALLITAAFSFPNLFMVNVPWVFGSAFYILLLYHIMTLVEEKGFKLYILGNIGANAMAYFFFGNILLFALWRLDIIQDYWAYPVYFIFIMASVYLVTSLTKKV